MKIKALLLGLGLGLIPAASLLWADDTEIYTNAGGGGSTVPKVILNLDVRPNVGSTTCNGAAACMTFLGEDPNDPNDLWDNLSQETKDRLANGSGQDKNLRLLELFSVVLHKVMSELLAKNFSLEVGVMLNHAHNNNCAPGGADCSNGAYVLEGLKPLTQAYADQIKNKLQYLATIDDEIDGGSVLTGNTGDASSHSFQGKELYFEMFRYLTGQAIYNGHQGYQSFDSKNAQKNENLNDDWPTASWDTGVEDGADYLSPLGANDECAKIYAINVLHQVSQQEDDSDSAISAALASGGTGAPRNTFPDMIEFMHDVDLSSTLDGDQGVISYFLSQHVNTTTNGYAQAGGTGSARDLDVPPDELIDDITNIFLEILSVSTTFVAASIPVNTFNRATVLNNVFFALFQAETGPVWPGNIKRLKLNGTTLVDANNDPAISAVDGRINHTALSFWTDPNGTDVQAFDPDENEVQGKDGRSVTRGGAGQQIPGFLAGDPGDNNTDAGARQMYTEPHGYTGGAATALEFNADDSSITGNAQFQADIGAADAAEAEELMRWLRGYAIDDLDSDPTMVDVRPWFLADSLHSQPIPVNYGARSNYTQENPDVRLIMGTNDGFIHMFRNAEDQANHVPDGSEDWAFAPRETLANARTLRLNQTNVGHPYGVDGPPTVWSQDLGDDGTINGADTVYAYFGLRRGGKSYYALDISDPDSATGPGLLWSVKKTGDTAELGLTFSQPKVGNVKFGANSTPVVVMAGGYNENKDQRPGPGTDDTDANLGAGNGGGNAVYILNANTGALVWKATYAASPSAATQTERESSQLLDSIPAEIRLVDVELDGIFDRFYVADSGGRLWRGDVPAGANAADKTKWNITLVADLGRHVNNNNIHDRRFFHSVDVVRHTDGVGDYFAIILGSGDRANPKETANDNKLFVIKDRKSFDPVAGAIIDPGNEWPFTLSDLGDVTDNCLQQEPTNCSPTPDLTNGWYLTLERSGEKMLSQPLTISGVILASTYLPEVGQASSCLPSEGGGSVYAVRLDNGGAAYNFDTTNPDLNKDDRHVDLPTPGIPPDPIFVPPTVCTDCGGSGGGGSGGGGGGGCFVGGIPMPPQLCNLEPETTFWYQVEDPDTAN